MTHPKKAEDWIGFWLELNTQTKSGSVREKSKREDVEKLI